MPLNKTKILKLEGWQTRYLIKNWDRCSFKEIANYLNGGKPSPKATERQVRIYGNHINDAIPNLCKPKDLPEA